MQFFAHQERARRNTRRLVVLFAAATVTIILCVYLVVLVALALMEESGGPGVFVLVVLGTLAVVGLAMLFKVSQLGKGGSAVAEMLGARPVPPGTRDLKERVLLNVVEETAIASGVPVPRVFVMDKEPGINAFAAGYSPSDAVVAVTRGTLETLDRDELQGVVAHEFSHILNGDMRLNIRLMGTLFGITCITTIGYIIFRAGFSGGGSRGNRKGGGGGAVLLVGGLGLMLVGSLGVFFGRLIQAAASRQREYLADASAVQFTRSPWGIAGALKKIAGFAKGAGSRLASPQAAEAGHFLFADGVSRFLGRALATHPPLEERIRRIDPGWKPGRPEAAPARAAAAPPAAGAAAGLSPEGAVAAVGTLTGAGLAWSASMLESLPAELREAVREPFSARAVIYCLLLDEDPELRRVQLLTLEERADPNTVRETNRLAARIGRAQPQARLPLVDMALPALRAMSAAQLARFQECLERLVEADRKVSLFEWTLLKVLRRHLHGAFEKRRAEGVLHPTLDPLGAEISAVLSALARAGGDGERAFAAAISALEGVSGLALLPDVGWEALDRALERLDRSAPAAKQRLLLACARCVAADGRILAQEADLLRALADTLGCPMPPLQALEDTAR